MLPSLENLIPMAVFAGDHAGDLVGARAGGRAAEDRPKTGCSVCSIRAPSRSARPTGKSRCQAKVAAAASKLGKSLRPSDEQELGKIRLKLLNAGFRQEQAVAVFFGIKLIGLLIALVVTFPTCVIYLGMTQTSLHGRGMRGRRRRFTCPTSWSASARRSGASRSFSACPMRWT